MFADFLFVDNKTMRGRPLPLPADFLQKGGQNPVPCATRSAARRPGGRMPTLPAQICPGVRPAPAACAAAQARARIRPFNDLSRYAVGPLQPMGLRARRRQRRRRGRAGRGSCSTQRALLISAPGQRKGFYPFPIHIVSILSRLFWPWGFFGLSDLISW